MPATKTAWPFYLLLIAVCPLSFLAHEAAHWAAGTALGYSMSMSMNSAAPIGGDFSSDMHTILVAAAGPLLTLIQALIAFLLIRSKKMLYAYPFLFIAWMMRLAAMFVSIQHPNDEARISMLLGLGTWTLPLLMVGLLSAMLVVASRQLGINWRQNLLCYLITSGTIAAIVFLDA